MIAIGLISGTSLDAIDAAAVEFELDGELLRGTLLVAGENPYPERLHDDLLAALPPRAADMEAVCRLDTGIGQAFAAAAARAIRQLPDPDAATFVCSHGQTAFHGVKDGRAWGTLQLGQPAWIAERTGLPVVSDLRTRDVAAGGEGAPLVAVMDRMLLAAAGRGATVAALNLGGIANATIVPADPAAEPLSYDIGPANALIDAAARLASDGAAERDPDGAGAAHGSVDAALLERLFADPYYDRAPPKSTGKERFNEAYLSELAGSVGGDELLATVTAHAAALSARELRRQGAERVFVSGGGSRNPTLMGLLRDGLGDVEVETTAALGVPPDAKEAIAMALLGWLAVHGVEGSVASCTGASGPRRLGSITPGAGAWAPPPPPPAPPRRLEMSDRRRQAPQ